MYLNDDKLELFDDKLSSSILAQKQGAYSENLFFRLSNNMECNNHSKKNHTDRFVMTEMSNLIII